MQILAILKQAEHGLPVADLIRHVGISEQTFYHWNKQYAGLESDQVRELKQVLEENARLKKLVAELGLGKVLMGWTPPVGLDVAEWRSGGVHPIKT